MNNRKKQLTLAVLTVLAALSLLSYATFAWITVNNATNVTPMEGSIGEGTGNLLISNSRNGPFDTTCDLLLTYSTTELSPLSTADMKNFYTAVAQNSKGIVTLYADATEEAKEATLHGFVYLTCEGSDCDVFWDTDKLTCGEDAQALAAMRLGITINGNAGTESYIFSLEDIGGNGGEATQTVPDANTVVRSIDASGNPTYEPDPRKSIAEYGATVNGEGEIATSNTRLYRLDKDEIAEVEFTLWLEGCDDNCINAVQSRDVALALAFCGDAPKN